MRSTSRFFATGNVPRVPFGRMIIRGKRVGYGGLVNTLGSTTKFAVQGLAVRTRRGSVRVLSKGSVLFRSVRFGLPTKRVVIGIRKRESKGVIFGGVGTGRRGIRCGGRSPVEVRVGWLGVNLV